MVPAQQSKCGSLTSYSYAQPIALVIDDTATNDERCVRSYLVKKTFSFGWGALIGLTPGTRVVLAIAKSLNT